MDCENWNWVSIRVLRPGARSTKALTSEHDDSMMYINKFDTYIVEGNVNAGNGTGKNQKKKAYCDRVSLPEDSCIVSVSNALK